MAKTMNRTATKRAVFELLSDMSALQDVQVAYSWPGPAALDAEHVYIDAVTGQHEPAHSGVRVRRNDEFTITLMVGAYTGSGDVEAAEIRCEEIVASIESMLADDPKLGGVDGLLHAVAGQVDGPDTDPTGQGPITFFRFDIDCLSRLI